MCLRRLKKKRPIPRKGVGMGRSNCLGSTAGLLLLRRIFCGYGVPAATARSSDLQLHLAAGYRASEFGNHGAIWRIAAHLKRDVAAVHLAVGNLHRRRSWRSPPPPPPPPAPRPPPPMPVTVPVSAAPLAVRSNVTGRPGPPPRPAISNPHLPVTESAASATRATTSRIISYKKQLLGHSNSLGVVPPRDVTPRTKEKRPCLRRSVNQDR